MKVSEFHYELPAELIAQHPLPERSASRLLCLDRATGELRDARFTDLPNLLREGDLLVFNDTRVIPARLHAHKASGGKAEILIERLLGAREALAQVKARRSPKPGSLLVLDGAGERGPRIEVTARDDSFFTLRLKSGSFIELLNTLGHVPLPPYIQREDDAADRERYQTVYARKPGAVAAPTAGLHFDDALLARLNQAGIARGFVTLHVGAGTFQPVRVREVEKHRMHAERIEVPPDLCRQAGETRRRGGRVIAVGTTAVRSLEAASRDGEFRPFAGDSRLFIYPGYEFRAVDGMITNFHLPESTLLMLVSAFGGRERVRAAYAHAVRQEYRFYSYGDAMLIL